MEGRFLVSPLAFVWLKSLSDFISEKCVSVTWAAAICGGIVSTFAQSNGLTARRQDGASKSANGAFDFHAGGCRILGERKLPAVPLPTLENSDHCLLP